MNDSPFTNGSVAMRRFVLASCVVFFAATVAHAGLEGGLTTKSTDWTRNPVPTMIKPSVEERTNELAQRKKDIAAQTTALQARLKRMPDAATMARVKNKLEEIKANCGWVPEIQHVFSLRDMQSHIDGADVLDPGLLAGYKQFQADLKKRGIDLIVMPFPGSSHFYTHRVVDGVDENDEIYPGYTKMLLTFLENDIEVVDFMDEFREAANGDMPVHWPNEPHTGSLGRKIAAEKLVERLQRYDFARDRREIAEKEFKFTETKWTGAKTGWSQYLLNARVMGNDRKEPLKSTNIPSIMDDMKKRPMSRFDVVYPSGANKKNPRGQANTAKYGFQDLVLIGDSQLHTPVFGDHLPEYVWAHLGGICRWGSKSWSGFSLPEIYLETVPNQPEYQPRVVVVFHLFSKLPAPKDGKSKYRAKPLPEMKAAPADGDPGTRPFNARIKVTEFSKPKDPNSVDYKEALMMAEATIVEGPLAGQTVGLRHEVMHKGVLSKSFDKGGQPRILDKVVNMRLVPWDMAVKKNPALGTIMVYDDVDLDLTAPIFWVENGPLDQRSMRKR